MAYAKTTWVNGATALSADNMNKIEDELVALDTGKADKVTGKDLSTNDFTNEYKAKLDGVAAGAEVNQNAFSNVKVGSSTVAADSKTDTLELVAGSNVTLTADTTNDKVTIASTNTTYNNATTSVAGLMSAADKTKLDGIFNLIYPVGSIYMSVNNTNPSTLFGGTWVAWGSGKVPVGVNASDTDFNTVEKTGGEKKHLLTASELPEHKHKFDSTQRLLAYADGASFYSINVAHASGYEVPAKASGQTWSGYKYSTTEGLASSGGQSHNNLQPYITCYMWKRTA